MPWKQQFTWNSVKVQQKAIADCRAAMLTLLYQISRYQLIMVLSLNDKSCIILLHKLYITSHYIIVLTCRILNTEHWQRIYIIKSVCTWNIQLELFLNLWIMNDPTQCWISLNILPKLEAQNLNDCLYLTTIFKSGLENDPSVL